MSESKHQYQNPVQNNNERDDVEDDAVIGYAFSRSLMVFVALGAIAGGIALLVSMSKREPIERSTNIVSPTYRDPINESEIPAIPLIDATLNSGINFKHYNGKAGERLLPETMGGGAGFLDYDNDGDQDLFLVNSTAWPWSSNVPADLPTMALYRNDGNGHFEDVTRSVGLDKSFYGMAPAFGDFDGDGWTDIYVTAVGRNRLFRNLQGNQFLDVAAEYGLTGGEDQWSCPAMWFDFDRDNKLDLLVGHYVDWDREKDLSQGFTLSGIGRAYGQPNSFSGTFLTLYHNTSDGFKEVSESAGLLIKNPSTDVPEAKSLAMALVDANADGWPDIFVANDTVRNFLFINAKDGTFNESGGIAGVALDRSGSATGAMGVDVANYRNNEDIAIAIGNFAGEPSSLYISRSTSPPNFFDAAASTGFGPQTKAALTFGLFFADMDLDGRQDIVCTNGHLEEEISKFLPSQKYEQSPQLFWNAGREAPTELVALDASKTGPEFQRPFVGRAACYADIDNDGDIDVLFVGNGQQAVLYRNDILTEHNWLRVKLKGKGGNSEAIGAKISIRSGSETYQRWITPTRSYASQCELPASFGFGYAKPTEMEIDWPDGSKQVVPIEALNHMMVVSQED